MVIAFSVILIGALALFRPLQKNSFYMLHAACVILAAYYLESKGVKVNPLNPKILLLFLVFHFVSINIVTIIAYWADKRAAKKGKWRVSEASLHTLELLGGWIGALIGQKIFRHKTKKREYQSVFWFLGLLQIVIIIVILKFLNIV